MSYFPAGPSVTLDLPCACTSVTNTKLKWLTATIRSKRKMPLFGKVEELVYSKSLAERRPASPPAKAFVWLEPVSWAARISPSPDRIPPLFVSFTAQRQISRDRNHDQVLLWLTTPPLCPEENQYMLSPPVARREGTVVVQKEEMRTRKQTFSPCKDLKKDQHFPQN